MDAGKGHNQITFAESGSFVHDTAILTATQVIRPTATAPVTVTITNTDGTKTTRTETGYAFIINYKATKGDFTPSNGANGVIFKTSQGSTNLYVPETGAATPTEVDCHGGSWFGNNDDIVVGWDGQKGGRFHLGVAGSTLEFLRSVLTVRGNALNAPPPASGILEVDDEGALTKETYTVATSAGPPPLGVLQRSGVAAIQYDNVGLTVNCGNHGNTIVVPGVEKGTTAIINTGQGKNTSTVGDSNNTLDEIAGMVSVNGQGAGDSLTINDQGDGFVNYTISGPTSTDSFSSIAPSVSAPIQWLNVPGVTLDGAKSALNYTVTSVRALARLGTLRYGRAARSDRWRSRRTAK